MALVVPPSARELKLKGPWSRLFLSCFLRAPIRGVFDFTVRGLVAVYRVPESAFADDCWPAGEYGVVFSSEEGGYPQIVIVLVEDGQVVRLDFNPGWSSFDLIWEKSDEFLLPPRR
jgi:hypothetical protein